jgi:predicted anti-sigma-YlaC factor YlaD
MARNQDGPPTDYGYMRCDDARLALSARLDGEAETRPAAVDEHLAGCAGCRGWLARAERITRTVRLQPVDVPDLTLRVLAVAHAQGVLPIAARGQAKVRWAGLRWSLGLLAVIQLMLAVPDLLGVVASHDAHAGREVAAFDIALVVGLLIAAYYPEHARIFAPVITTLVVCFAAISALDIMQGAVTPNHVAVHVIAVLQAVLLWQLARRVDPRPSSAESGTPAPVTNVS